jgi:putative sigma-54 modulation protein
MAIEITGRHVSVTDSIRDYAEKRMEKVQAEFAQVDSIHVILDVQKYLHSAEVVLHAKRHIRLEARETSENMYASIDLVTEKIEAQLRRTLDKRHEHKGRGSLSDLESKQDHGEQAD